MGARRVVLHDRRARPRAIVEWRADGSLDTASVRIPDGSWLTIEPRAGTEAPWGAVDRVWHGATPGVLTEATPLTTMTSVTWEGVRTIPTVAEPARLPAGAGTAVLNLLATLAHEQGARTVRYDGPYPTEALFLALLECFDPDPAEGDPLARFAEGTLAWIPAPFTPSFEDEAYVQWRERIDKVVWRERAYYRETWGTVRRRAHLRVLDDAGVTRCVLWALGAPLEDHLLIEGDNPPRVVILPSADAGSPRSDGRDGLDELGRLDKVVIPPSADAGSPRSDGRDGLDELGRLDKVGGLGGHLGAHPTQMSRAARDGIVAIVIAMSAPALAPAIREVAAELSFTWGPVPLDLARVDIREARASSRLHAAFHERLASETSADGKIRLALAALGDVAGALGDVLRARAQRRLAEAGPEAQAEALAREGGDPDAARLITAAAADLATSGGVDDEPDVERDERRDRHD